MANMRAFFKNIRGIYLYLSLYFSTYFQVSVRCFKPTNLNESSPLTAASVPGYTKKENHRETQTPLLFVRYYLPQAMYGIDEFIFLLTGLRLNALIPFIHSR